MCHRRGLVFGYHEHMPLAAEVTCGDLIRRIRGDRGWSLRVLARAIEVSPATLSAVENGHTAVTVDRLLRIAGVLRVDPAELLPTVSAGSRPSRQPRAAFTRPPPEVTWRDFPALDLDPVLAAAIRCFVATGYHGSTVRTIATAAGVSIAGVYQRSEGKQDLLVQALDLTMDELDWRLADARASAPGGNAGSLVRLATLVEALALFHTRRADLAFIGATEMRSIRPADRGRIARRRSAVQRLLDREIADAVTVGLATTRHPHEVGRAIATMCTSLPQWFDNAGPTTPEAIAHEYALLALQMIGTRRQARPRR